MRPGKSRALKSHLLLVVSLLMASCSGAHDGADAGSAQMLPEYSPPAGQPSPYECKIIEYHFPSGEGGVQRDYTPLLKSAEIECMCRQFINGSCTERDQLWYHGRFERWHENGQRAQLGSYRYDEVHGRWLVWGYDGVFQRGTCWDHADGIWETQSEEEAWSRPCPTEFVEL